VGLNFARISIGLLLGCWIWRYQRSS